MKLPIILSLLATSILWGQKETQKRSAGTHEHGSGTLGITFDGQQGRFEWKIPMESIVGFEYKATTPQDKKKVADALEVIRTRFAEMVILPPKAGCKFDQIRAESKFADHGDHTHSDLEADGRITCQQPPAGEVRFSFRTHFPGVHKTTVQFLSEDVQTGAEIANDTGVLKIDVRKIGQ
jgi:hypothetical protein